jgi:tRNA(fMet)-specific endonuclease VapC
LKYMLDTNAAIGMTGRNAGILATARQHRQEDIGISAIVAHELFFGAYKGQRTTQNLARINKLRLQVLEFDKEDAMDAGEVRAELAAAGTPIGPYDVLIAGQARGRGLTLVTHNLREFSRVRDLHIEDWET